MKWGISDRFGIIIGLFNHFTPKGAIISALVKSKEMLLVFLFKWLSEQEYCKYTVKPHQLKSIMIDMKVK